MYTRSLTSGDSGTSALCEGSGKNKVDRVCAAVRSALMSMETKKFLLSIITTHVRETSPNLEAVLTILKELKGIYKYQKSRLYWQLMYLAHLFPISASSDIFSTEEAVKYSLLLVDVNELYNIALGMYDFELVLLVAEKSQKDPKEYLPFLNELQRLPVDYQRYKIDVYLKRYEKALQHISKCGMYYNCVNLSI